MSDLFSLRHLAAGFVAILVGYTSSAAIVFQAAQAGGATPEQLASWMWALGLGLGVGGIALSLYFRAPIILAWSTPGAALLVTSLPGIPLPEAIGAFLLSSALILLCGLTGWFDKIVNWVPQSLACALLAGVLLRFGLAIFPAFEEQHGMVAGMLVVYVWGRLRKSTYTIPLTFLTGTAIAVYQGLMNDLPLTLELTSPVWTTPAFSLSTLIGVAVPLFIVTMASQNVPGIAVLRAHGYRTPASPVITATGVTGMLMAGFGGFAYNFAAITAALCMGDDVNRSPDKRYWAAVWAGFFYLLAGLFGATVAAWFSAFPASLVAAIAGIALLGTVATSLVTAFEKPGEREAAIVTFIVTASSGSFLSLATPFWGLLAGLVIYALSRSRYAV